MVWKGLESSGTERKDSAPSWIETTALQAPRYAGSVFGDSLRPVPVSWVASDAGSESHFPSVLWKATLP